MTENDSAQPAEQNTDVAEDAPPVEESVETAEAFDDTDVDEAKHRSTDDGKGGAVVPKEDFESYDSGENVTAYKQEEND